MAQVRNVSGEELVVPEIGFLGATVPPDGVLDVPDDRFDAFTSQAATWAPVTPPKKPTKNEKDKP